MSETSRVFEPGRYLGKLPIGFLDVPLAPWDLDHVLAFAKENGFESAEFGAWPKETSRAAADAFVCNHLDPKSNFTDFPQAKADEIGGKIKQAGIGLDHAKWGYYDNFLEADPAVAGRYHTHFRNIVLAAQKTGVKRVGIFVGRRQGTTVDESLRLYPTVIKPLVQFADDHGVTTVVEHCPMEDWVVDPKTGRTYRIGNIANSPRNLRYMFEVTPSLRLCYDPSHLDWQGINGKRFAREFKGVTTDVHGKDFRRLNSGLWVPENYDQGGFDDSWPIAGWGGGVYTNAIPGQGSNNWGEVLGAVREKGEPFDVNIELEAGEYKVRVDPERSAFGLLVARENLIPYCKAQAPHGVY